MGVDSVILRMRMNGKVHETSEAEVVEHRGFSHGEATLCIAARAGYSIEF
jgi:hypothetical protein